MDLYTTSTHLLWMKKIHTTHWPQKSANVHHALKEEEKQKHVYINDGEL